MSAPITLTNPRHEAFALAVARGHLPATAYRLAGFSDSNAKARALALAQEPHIQARIQHLRACLPHIETVHQHFAPSLLLVPETRDEMIAWLWQIANGTRAVVPTQLRAATLLCRLKGWHLNPPAVTAPSAQQPAPPPKPPPLIPSERATLARLGQLQAESEATLQSLPAEQTDRFYSTMADLAIIAAHRYPQARPVPCITGTPPATEPEPEPEPEAATHSPRPACGEPERSADQHPQDAQSANAANQRSAATAQDAFLPRPACGEPERSADRHPEDAQRVSAANQRAGVRGAPALFLRPSPLTVKMGKMVKMGTIPRITPIPA